MITERTRLSQIAIAAAISAIVTLLSSGWYRSVEAQGTFRSAGRFQPGTGEIVQIAGADPAAGAQMLETVPAGHRWRLLSVRIALTTSATAANREIGLCIETDAPQLYFFSPSRQNQIASLSRSYNFFPGVATTTPVTNTEFTVPIPDNQYLLPGYRLETCATNFQVGDDIGVPRIQVERWRQ
jgi:hypothetical protein